MLMTLCLLHTNALVQALSKALRLWLDDVEDLDTKEYYQVCLSGNVYIAFLTILVCLVRVKRWTIYLHAKKSSCVPLLGKGKDLGAQ